MPEKLNNETVLRELKRFEEVILPRKRERNYPFEWEQFFKSEI
jgi:hypothetical protein